MSQIPIIFIEFEVECVIFTHCVVETYLDDAQVTDILLWLIDDDSDDYREDEIINLDSNDSNNYLLE